MLEAAVALGSLTALELVLGIDNIVFLSVLVGRLPIQEQSRARTIGLALALLLRILLLLGLSWLSALTAPLLQLGSRSLSGRDLILLAGGLFLLWKTANEIHQMLEAPPTAKRAEGRTSSHLPRLFTRLGRHSHRYGAMAFSLLVELLNLRVGARSMSATRTES